MTLRILEPFRGGFVCLRASGPDAPAPGTVLVADLATGIPALAEAVLAQRAAPWCPLVTLMGDHGFPPSVLAAFEPLPGSFAPLYPSDFRTLDLPQRVVAAVHRRSTPEPAIVVRWIEQRLGRPGAGAILACCVAPRPHVGRSGRTLTRRVRELGPLAVRDWRGLTRLVQITAAAGSGPMQSLETTAWDRGVDPRTLQRWLQLATDLPWTEVVRRPGWEWLLESALRRGGNQPLAQPARWRTSVERWRVGSER
jgi:hypothetical protein